MGDVLNYLLLMEYIQNVKIKVNCSFVAEQRDKLNDSSSGGGGGTEDYLDTRQKDLDDMTERRLQQIIKDYQEDINNNKKGKERYLVFKSLV